MALTTSAVHSDVARGGGRHPQGGTSLPTASRARRRGSGGRHPRGGTSLGKSVLACECGCVLVSWAHGTVST